MRGNTEDGSADKLFTLRFKPFQGDSQVTITAYREECHDADGKPGVVLEVKHGRKVIFPRGQLWGRLAPRWNLDGPEAKRWAVDCVCYAVYRNTITLDQRAWVQHYGDALNCEASHRYGGGS